MNPGYRGSVLVTGRLSVCLDTQSLMGGPTHSLLNSLVVSALLDLNLFPAVFLLYIFFFCSDLGNAGITS